MATQGDATCNKRTQGQRKVPATQEKKKKKSQNYSHNSPHDKL